MSDAGFFRGTSTDQDNRFSNKDKKLMKEMRFANSLSVKVDMSKIKLEVVKPWVTQRIYSMLGVEDDVVVEFVFNQLEEEKFPDPKKIQIMLTGFLNGKNARIFVGELWEMLSSAQSTSSGIPLQLLEQKKEEIKKQLDEDEWLHKKQDRLKEKDQRSTRNDDIKFSSRREKEDLKSEQNAANKTGSNGDSKCDSNDNESVAKKMSEKKFYSEIDGAINDQDSKSHHQISASETNSASKRLSSSPHIRQRSSPSRNREVSPRYRKKSPSPRSRRKRTPSPRHRSHKRSVSPRPRKRTPNSHSRKRSTNSPRSRKRSPSPHTRKRSLSPHSRKRSPSPHSRKKSLSPHTRKRSQSPRSRKRSPSPHSRKRSPSPRSRKRSSSPRSRKRSYSPISRKRSCSPILRKSSLSPFSSNKKRSSSPRSRTQGADDISKTFDRSSYGSSRQRHNSGDRKILNPRNNISGDRLRNFESKRSSDSMSTSSDGSAEENDFELHRKEDSVLKKRHYRSNRDPSISDDEGAKRSRIGVSRHNLDLGGSHRRFSPVNNSRRRSPSPRKGHSGREAWHRARQQPQRRQSSHEASPHRVIKRSREESSSRVVKHKQRRSPSSPMSSPQHQLHKQQHNIGNASRLMQLANYSADTIKQAECQLAKSDEPMTTKGVNDQIGRKASDGDSSIDSSSPVVHKKKKKKKNKSSSDKQDSSDEERKRKKKKKNKKLKKHKKQKKHKQKDSPSNSDSNDGQDLETKLRQKALLSMKQREKTSVTSDSD